MSLTIRTTIKLKNDVAMPLFGFGTYQVKSEEMSNVLSQVIKNGYIHIDTAAAYRNEEAIGRELESMFSKGIIKREDLFITSKASTQEHGYDNAIEACHNSLKRLKLDYLDLYLIHWPGCAGLKPQDPKNSEIRKETWRGFEQLYKDKKCRSIGVSNYNISHLRELMKHASIVPHVNQVEFHPFLNQKELHQFCIDNGIVLEAYSSLARASFMDNPVIEEVSKELNKTKSQILLRWAIQKNIPVIPKSVNSERIKENCEIFDFVIPNHLMSKLDSLEEKRICWDPTTVHTTESNNL
eukprot:gene5077-6319_t